MTYPTQRGRATRVATSTSRLVVEHTFSLVLSPLSRAVSRRTYGLSMGRSRVITVLAPPPPPLTGPQILQAPYRGTEVI